MALELDSPFQSQSLMIESVLLSWKNHAFLINALGLSLTI